MRVRAQGVAVSGGSNAVYIDLGQRGDSSACAELAWHFLGQVMLSAAVRKVLWDVPEQVPCLIAGGMPFTGAGVEDAKASQCSTIATPRRCALTRRPSVRPARAACRSPA